MRKQYRVTFRGLAASPITVRAGSPEAALRRAFVVGLSRGVVRDLRPDQDGLVTGIAVVDEIDGEGSRRRGPRQRRRPAER